MGGFGAARRTCIHPFLLFSMYAISRVLCLLGQEVGTVLYAAISTTRSLTYVPERVDLR